jgi:hypothetical protein
MTQENGEEIKRKNPRGHAPLFYLIKIGRQQPIIIRITKGEEIRER